MRISTKILLLFVAAIFVCTSFVTLLADHEHGRKRHQHQENRLSKDHENENNHHRSAHRLKPVTNQTYSETCGACHFAYQPELLPSDSWTRILSNLNDHFGEEVDIDSESKSTIGKYLVDNAADRSSSKRAVKIVKSLGGQTSSRISEVPYIRRKHHELSTDVVNRETIGSLSNCTACHRSAEQGIYEDDDVVIPQ